MFHNRPDVSMTATLADLVGEFSDETEATPYYAPNYRAGPPPSDSRTWDGSSAYYHPTSFGASDGTKLAAGPRCHGRPPSDSGCIGQPVCLFRRLRS